MTIQRLVKLNKLDLELNHLEARRPNHARTFRDINYVNSLESLRVRRRIHSNVGASNTSVIVKEQLEPHQEICLAACAEFVRATASTHRFLRDFPGALCISDVTRTILG
jgi:hypothetical protein